MGIPYAEVIGDPIAHSKSPAIHRFWLKKLGIEADYRAVRMTADALHDYLIARRGDPDWRGCNVTMPLKQVVMHFIGRIDREAEGSGAVNTIVRDQDGARRGYNTDILAIAECLTSAGRSAYPNHVATYVQIIGTGGAARAAAYGAIAAGYTALDMEFFGRNIAAARALAGAFSGQPGFGQDLSSLGGGSVPANAGREQRYSNVLINASPLGMRGYPPLEIDIGSYHDDTIVLDLVYDPVETLLLKGAREKGLKTIDGLEILVAQAAHAFRLFFGVESPCADDAELRELLTR
ncbi:MAG TPA: shikimate dehydrogenase [Allosphingosinicella sp.]|nr:shikimate dehydrogenase [Allosphingosinicella sp.]